jgi:glutathione-regulated potassium-efflux system ancillary protein KefF
MMTLVVLAHPYPDRSRANRALIHALDGLTGVEVRSLYDLYPDFAIDAAAEREALAAASLVVWQHPLFWYSVPALLKLWFEKVLTPGWAWGHGGTALRGKRCLWVVTTGGDALDYSPSGIHRHPLEAFVPSVRQTAEFCGMVWLEPLVVQEARQLDAEALAEWGLRYRARLAALAAEEAASDE